MENFSSSLEFRLRPATHTDAQTIRKIISSVNINPMGLNWQRFILVVDQVNNVIGCGQIKPHSDGSFELASIAVLPEWRNRSIARRVIEHLLEQHPGRLYLTCRSPLGPMYQKFGFEAIRSSEMPPYFKRINRMVALFSKLFHRPDHLLVMRRN
jgi:N-acetylglutamate synthase-like GNAT family acetyltransferase